MKLYRFDIEETRRATLWIEAESEDDALVDAEVLAVEMEPSDWQEFETDLRPLGEQTPTSKVVYWTGGAGGREELWEPK